MKHLHKAFFVALTVLSICPSALAGPADTYADQCRYMYEEERYMAEVHGLCLTPKGRILKFTFRYYPDTPDVTANTSNTYFREQMGLLNNDFTFYSKGQTIAVGKGKTISSSGSYITNNFKQIDNGNKLLVYSCSSNSSGTCNDGSSKKIFNYIGQFGKATRQPHNF